MSDGQIAEVKTKGGNGIVKLSDVFEKYGTDVNYVIEIRYANERNIMPFVETVKKAGVADVTSVSSYYFGALDIVENEFPDMPKIFLSENEVDLAEAQGSDIVDLISVDRDLMNEENLAAVHESGKKFGAWTLNSEEDIRSAVSMGLDSYFTDEGALAVSIEKGE
jgi:glycerophosphoryl diester phosphodiesterase